MGSFAQPILARNQRTLFQTTLDDAISEVHDVRILDEILSTLDWSEWEAEYCLVRGQPPIHPKIIASVILYGLMRRIRSSRVLEYMTSHNVDFMWLTEGRTIDHSTIASFRTRFKKQLREAFRQLGRRALMIGVVQLAEVTFDGTRVKANNSRSKTWTAEDVEEQLAELVAKFGELLEDAEKTDATENAQFSLSENKLPADLLDAKARRKKLQEVLEELRDADAIRQRKRKIDPKENPSQMPSTDPDSKVLPNKEGGHAPNYTPVTGVDANSDFIVYADVIAHANENTHLVTMVDAIKDDFGVLPQAVLTDALNATGPNIATMRDRNVEFLSPLPCEQSVADPAQRANPSEPIAEVLLPQLPINPQTKAFDKTCFIYDPELDIYYCPMGKTLVFEKTKPDVRQGQKISIRVYRCSSCKDCALAPKCLSKDNQHGRTILRDTFTKVREEHAVKMKTTEAIEKYKHRFHAAETPFGWLKHVLGLRYFLLRGLEKVQMEWLWACAAYDLKKLLPHIGALRSCLAKRAISVEN